MKDEIAGGMSNFPNSSVCYLYYFFFPANVLCFPHCDQSLLWKEPERPRCPGHSSLGKGLGSAMAQLRAGSQPGTLSWARGWEQPWVQHSLIHILPRAGAPRAAGVPVGVGAVRGSLRTCGSAGASCGARAPSPPRG